MINANELRIGNYINTPRGIECMKRAECITEVEDYSDKFNPIPLTPEILEKCGFEEVEGNIYYKFFDYKEFRVFIHKENNSVFMYWKGNTVDDSVNNLPIHRLQNIIFALTGEELNYTP